MSEAILRIDRLEKHYAGLTVTDGVSLDIETGELHAIIGPNGAGKTTLIAQLAGQVAPDAGHIWFGGRDIARATPPERAKAGIARSFQITSIFPNFTTLANVAIAVQGRKKHSFRFWRPADRDPALTEPAPGTWMVKPRALLVSSWSSPANRLLRVVTDAPDATSWAVPRKAA